MAFDARSSAERRRWLRWTVSLVVCGGLLQTCSAPPSELERVRSEGVLRMATIPGSTTYIEGEAGPSGFEYELALAFAERLGLRLQPVLSATLPQAVDAVLQGRADFVAAGLSINDRLRENLRFTEPLATVVPQLVYRAERGKPIDLDRLDGEIGVVADSVYVDYLRALASRHPQLRWSEVEDASTEELLRRVADGELDYTIANSDLVAINRRYYPNLRVGLAVADSQQLAWAFRAHGDETLVGAAGDFFRNSDAQALARLRDRYFGHVEHVDYLGAVALAEHYERRLPRYRRAFEEAAQAFDLDWRLLAAIAYQESTWDPQATSPTGVRGLMQLTLETASFVRVDDRTDPVQSIWGGARFYRWLKDELPASIAEPDRTWFALAAYNMGMGHVLDARSIAAKRGGDPDHWLDVRNVLPLLTRAEWHRQTRHGYARAYQALHYVGNIRTYYDMLVWMSDSAARSGAVVDADTPAVGAPETAPASPVEAAPTAPEPVLEIQSPVI